MARKILVRLVGVIACMAAVVTGFDAEAGWRHRRCCYDSCCYSSCCTPRCDTGCCNTGCSTCYTWRDACGHCRTGCGCTVASTAVIVEGCCASAAPAAPATQAAAQPATHSPTPASTAAR
ncbi:MAG: hypothetical protein ACKOZU_01810 [Planctomycetaceae bacterium]